MEENKQIIRKDLDNLMGKIAEAFRMEKEKQKNIDTIYEEMRNETRPVVVEEKKEELENLKEAKKEFDEMTEAAINRAKENIAVLKKQSEKNYLKALLLKDNVEQKLEDMRAHKSSPEVIKRAEKVSQKIIEDQEKIIEEYFRDIKEFDEFEKGLDDRDETKIMGILKKVEGRETITNKQEEPKQEEPKQEELKQEEKKEEEKKQEEKKKEEKKQGEPKQKEQKREEPKKEETYNKENRKNDSVAIKIDVERGIIEYTKKENDEMQTEKVSLDEAFSERSKIRKECLNYVRQMIPEERFSKREIRKLNPAILKVLLKANDVDTLAKYINFSKGYNDLFPFRYEVNLENPIGVEDKTFINLNSQILHDNKNLDLNINAIPNLRWKTFISKLPIFKRMRSSLETQKLLPSGVKVIRNEDSKFEPQNESNNSKHNSFIESLKSPEPESKEMEDVYSDSRIAEAAAKEKANRESKER